MGFVTRNLILMHANNKDTDQSSHLCSLIRACDFHNLLSVLSYDVASGSEITPCNKIDKPLVVYRLS